MIEIVYEKEKQKPVGNEAFFRIPNNIRQIGEINEAQKIYIEDYAYTYLSRLSSENMYQGKAAVLLGQTNWQNGVAYLFVKSAIALSEMEVSEDHLVFSDEVWNHVYDKSKEYFQDQEIVGWFLSIPGCSMELHEVICRTHLNHFGGNDKVLLVMEPTEKEEAFYRYEEGQLIRQTGYYIYYEKNDPMQDYLISINENKSIEKDMVEDKAVKNFRKIIETKNDKKVQKKGSSFIYAASTCLVAAALIAGVIFINDYQKLKSMESAISGLANPDAKAANSKSVEGQDTKNISEDQAAEKDSDKETDLQSDKATGTSETSQPKTDKGTDTSGSSDNTNKNAPADTEHNSAEGDKQVAGQTDKSQSANTEPVKKSYTIQRGDTLTSISTHYYGSSQKINEICAINGFTEEQTIYPGQIILLP